MASGRISRVRLIFFLTLFSDSGHVARCYWVKSRGLPQDDHARPTNSTILLDYAYRVNQCSRGQKWSHLLGPKLFVLSLMVKMLLPVAYSWLHCSKIDGIMDLLLLLLNAAASFPVGSGDETTAYATLLSRDLHDCAFAHVRASISGPLCICSQTDVEMLWVLCFHLRFKVQPCQNATYQVFRLCCWFIHTSQYKVLWFTACLF